MVVKDISVEVAERVMGWKLTNYESLEEASTLKDYEKAEQNDGWFWDGRKGSYEAYQWQPDSEIRCTWEVVEKMRADGYNFMCGISDHYEWYCRFWKKSGAAHRSESSAGIHMAICEAALGATVNA